MPPKKKKTGPPSVATTASNPDLEDTADITDNNNTIEWMSYPRLLDRRHQIDERLAVISIPDVPKRRSKGGRLPARSSPSTGPMAPAIDFDDESDDHCHEIPFVPKTDTHWDYVMKEMMWLGADFQAERKRQFSLAKKCGSSVRQFHATMEARRVRELAQAEVKRRKLAARMGREVRGWWTKLERVIAYKQKLEADEERNKAMNRQLVVLVQQTEKYTESLAAQTTADDDDDRSTEEEDGSNASDMDDLDGKMDANSSGDERRKRPKKRQKVTIEEALASENSRKSKTHVVDYSRMKLEATEFYGESTASDASGSDGSFSAPDDSDESDDDSTLRAAIKEELQERQEQSSTKRFVPDPEELRKLHEERTMDIGQVLQRLQQVEAPTEEDRVDRGVLHTRTKKVKFAQDWQNPSTIKSPKPDPGEDADDDGDASDVEDYDESRDHSDEEYEEAGEVEKDDETTIAQEERLPQEMSHTEELDMLRKGAEIPIEELRKIHASVLTAQHDGMHEEVENVSKQVEQLENSSVGDDDNDDDDDNSDQEDYQMGEPEVDDETTIAQEESLPREMSYAEEIDMLKEGAEIPIEELRKMYSGVATLRETVVDEEVQEEEDDLSVNSPDEANLDDDDDEYTEDSAVPVVDDETTIEAEEKLGRDMTYQEELDMLKRENDLSVEELKAMYAGINGNMEDDDDDDDIDGENDSDSDNEMKKEEGTILGDTVAMRTAPSQRSKRTWEGRSKGKEGNERKDPLESEMDEGTAALNALEASAEKAQQTLASRPFLLAPWVKLRMYQQIGLNWLVSLQARRLNGILADEMGLGKTLQTISLLAYLAAYKGIWGPHLVIVPTSVILNWETELKRFCPGFKVLCYYGSAKRRKELRTGWTKTNWYHVVITSYQLAVQDAFAFKRKKWYYLILDEAQNIKNFKSQRWQSLISFNTQRRLLLTGTPLQNSLMELWSLLHFLMPYIFRSRKEFSYWFANPMNSIIEGSNGNDDVIKRLHGIIRPFVLRRLKKDVETQMPGKYEHIVKCQLSRRQMTLYEEFLSRSSTRQALKKGGNFMGMMNVLMQLRKVCNHPDLFSPRSVTTPFILPSIQFLVPRCVCKVEDSTQATHCLSECLLRPLWTGSSGIPSIDSALRHDTIESCSLIRLHANNDSTLLTFEEESECPKELRNLLEGIYSARRQADAARVSFQNEVNRRRCTCVAFCYSSRLQDLVQIETTVFHRQNPVEVCRKKVIDTPTHVLALRKAEQERADDLSETIEKFVFCVPPAGAMHPILDNGISSFCGSMGIHKDIETMLLEPVEKMLLPYRKTHARLSSFFPDKKLVQYDSGKLQTLAQLLRQLKQGGHRALIFTQMSKMLDILEAFLNIHGYTYLRLDGATGVDRRQRYMDRFNNDTKIFCFILSTRSGGMGINLTGADTVIFYDSDWNPAMDAQAQDRAHRIGQTRDVHIYRLITEHTIEENILAKAKQKKNLDIMVMDKGKFDALSLLEKEESAGVGEGSVKDVYTKRGLQAILGIMDEEDKDGRAEELIKGGDADVMSKEQMEMAMTSLEDEDDVKALLGAQQEAADELKEFDENAEIHKNSDDEDEDDAEHVSKIQSTKLQGKESLNTDEHQNEDDDNGNEKDLEKEFASWQSTSGFDGSTIENSLSPMERYGLRFREEIDPFYSVFLINEERRKMEALEDEEDIDIEELEKGKALEERQAMEDGDLLATWAQPEDLIRQRNLYRREKARLRSDKKRRKLTGENWSERVDGLTQKMFWYNEDTGEAIWETPHVVADIRAEETAAKEGWGKIPLVPLVKIMEFLAPFPDRQSSSVVCRQWRLGANDIRFVRHVYPVEMGSLLMESDRRHYNHFAEISDALRVALPGDTIELSDGHYYVNDPVLLVEKPIKLVGDENNPANVVVEMSGSVQWSATGGWIEGITFRRPKILSGAVPSFPMVEIIRDGKIDVIQSVFDNAGSTGNAVVLSGSGNKGKWDGVSIRNGGSAGVFLMGDIRFKLMNSTVKGNKGTGLVALDKANVELSKCKVVNNNGYGIRVATGCRAVIHKSHFARNKKGVLLREVNCNLTCSGNEAIVTAMPGKTIPGFKLSLQHSSIREIN